MINYKRTTENDACASLQGAWTSNKKNQHSITGGVYSMKLFNTLTTVLGNGFISFFFYCQMYAVQMIILVLLIIAAGIEYAHVVDVKGVDDERKLV